MKTAGRNELCHCGSGKKSKRCHGDSSAAPAVARGTLLVIAPLALLAGLGVYASLKGKDEQPRRAAAAATLPAPAAPVASQPAAPPGEAAGEGAAPAGQLAARPPGPAPAGKVWSDEHGHWHDTAPSQPAVQVEMADGPGSGAVRTTGSDIRIDANALPRVPEGAGKHPRPPGPAPEGKVWSTDHGHWHDAPTIPSTLPVHLGTLNTPKDPIPQPSPAPAGKVWSAEHGHWHNAPANPPR